MREYEEPDDKDVEGEWPIRWAWLIPIVLIAAGFIGACDPPPADAALPDDHPPATPLADYGWLDEAALAIELNPCPINLDPGNRRAPFDPATIEGCIRHVWPDDLEDKAVAVVFGSAVLDDGTVLYARKLDGGRVCVESGGNPNAIGGVAEIGVFQLHPAHFGPRGYARKLGYTKIDAYDPQVNTELALHLYTVSKSGWRSWTCADRGWGRKG